MEKPRVIQVESQKVESEREVSGYEAEEILRKYGYGNQQYSSIPEPKQINPNQDLSFEEMLKLEEEKRKSEYLRNQQKISGPKPITFAGQNGYDSEIKYGQDEDLGFGFKIEIVSDMKIPK